MTFSCKGDDTCCVRSNAMLMRGVVHFTLKESLIYPFLCERTYFETDVTTLSYGPPYIAKACEHLLYVLQRWIHRLLSLRVKSKVKRTWRKSGEKFVCFFLNWSFWCVNTPIMVMYICISSAQEWKVCWPFVLENSLAMKVKIHHMLV